MAKPASETLGLDQPKVPADPASKLTGAVRIKAVRTFYANGSYLVEPGKSIELPAERAEVHLELGEAELVDDEAAPDADAG